MAFGRDEARKAVGSMAKELREKNGVGQRELSRRINVNQSNLYNFESGKRLLTRTNFRKYLDGCNITGADRIKLLNLFNQASARLIPFD